MGRPEVKLYRVIRRVPPPRMPARTICRPWVLPGGAHFRPTPTSADCLFELRHVSNTARTSPAPGLHVGRNPGILRHSVNNGAETTRTNEGTPKLSIQSTPITSPDKHHVALADIHALVADQMDDVNRLISARLRSDVVLINQLAGHIIHNSGKRLRPITVLLSAGACNHKGDAHVPLAAIVEFIHTATLLHDDVVDNSDLRRGQPTANEIWGNQASVLVGDFLYSRSFEMMVEIGSMRVMEIMAETTNLIAEGEVMQLMNCHTPDLSEEQYLETVRRKTAKLFESAAQLGAVVSNQSSAVENAMAEYGLHLGAAFQFIDDVLDYSADSEQTGKNIGDDLAEGKPTLPVINALTRATPVQRAVLTEAIERGGREYIDDVLAAIESTGSLAYTARRAREEAELAQNSLAILPDTPYKQGLMDLAVFAVERSY